MQIPFARVPLGGNELTLIEEVLESGWLTTSSKTHQFEHDFAEFIGASYACAVNSCTAALHLAIEATGIQSGDKVFVPSLTFTASAEIIRYMGADPIFLDVEYGTCLVTPSILENAIAQHPGTKALILVHYGGQAAELTNPDGRGIVDLCKLHNINLIEDAAHAFPTRLGDQFIGSSGNACCFSFYANKTITTGEGGMLLTNDEKLYKRAKVMRLHGISRDIWARFTDTKSSWEYDVIAPGFKYNMADVNAAIGLAQLAKAEYFRSERQRCAAHYYNELKELNCIDLPVCNCAYEDHAWHLFPVIIRPEAPVTRNDFIQRMADKGIGTSVHYKPLHRMEYYRETYGLKPDDFPNTERIWNGTVSLPIYPDLNEQELEYICKSIKDILS
jgi:dTDP-4-amino-4,6-dideoxygalactose transaminase